MENDNIINSVIVNRGLNYHDVSLYWSEYEEQRWLHVAQNYPTELGILELRISSNLNYSYSYVYAFKLDDKASNGYYVQVKKVKLSFDGGGRIMLTSEGDDPFCVRLNGRLSLRILRKMCVAVGFKTSKCNTAGYLNDYTLPYMLVRQRPYPGITSGYKTVDALLAFDKWLGHHPEIKK